MNYLRNKKGQFIKGDPSLINLIKHGDNRRGKMTRLYRIWRSMIARCRYPNRESYRYYGKKGIIVCLEWEKSYPAFKKWALANGYADNLTIDRIDGGGDYKPSNCQWITHSENARKSAHKRWRKYKIQKIREADHGGLRKEA